MSENERIFTLKQVLSSVRKTLEDRYQSLYWVKAEMHKLNKFASGHCFPELLQKEDGKIIAQIGGTIWSHNFERINKRFFEVVKEPLKEDTTLLMQVRISFHETYGLSLQIMDIDPNYALGELQRERQETLKRLQKEGLLNLNQGLHFPILPKRVAIISAESSKGLSDFMNVLDQNEWGYSIFTMLFPAYLQGDNAAKSIIHQLNQINKVKAHFDIVVIVRGGGGEVGLSCYNNFDLCAKIASFPLPVLTGIGHSTNLTVAEMVSFRNAITPTELADFILQSFHNVSVPINEAMKRIKFGLRAKLIAEKKDLANTSNLFIKEVQQCLRNSDFKLISIRQNLKSNFKFEVQKHHDNIKAIEKSVVNSTKSVLVAKNAYLYQLEQSIRNMDPINVLKRGYSITTIKGVAIENLERIKTGDIILTKTAKFIIESEITSAQE